MPELPQVADDLSDTPHRSSSDPELPLDGRSRDVRLAFSVAEMARALAAASTLDETLDRLTHLVTHTVPGCQHAGVTVSGPGSYTTRAATSELVRAVDRHQYESGEGPCVDALREHEVFRTDDLLGDPRWPRFGEAAADLGIRSMLSYRLFGEDDTYGSLNLYSSEVAAFSDRAVDIGAVLAAHAALALDHASERDSARNLESALDSSRTVSMAMGILMALERVDQQRAFDLLREASQQSNVKLRDVADEVVRTGALPQSLHRPRGGQERLEG